MQWALRTLALISDRLELQTSSDPFTWVDFGNEITASLSLLSQWCNEHVYESLENLEKRLEKNNALKTLGRSGTDI